MRRMGRMGEEITSHEEVDDYPAILGRYVFISIWMHTEGLGACKRIDDISRVEFL